MGFIKPNNNSGGSGGGLTPQELSRLNNAYTHSKSEHAPTTAEQNVQPDWSETDETSDAYIKNKPDLSQIGSGGNIPSVTQIEPQELDMPKVFFNGDKPTNKTSVHATIEYISKTQHFKGYVDIKCQGNSSMAYPKKNYTIKMFTDETKSTKLKKDFKGWGKQSKFCLKANYIDHSHARNVVSAKLWGQVVESRSDFDTLPEELKTSPNYGAVDGFPIKVYYNGTYEGVYTWNIPKDSWMNNMDDKLDTHCILCGEEYVSGCFRSANASAWSDELHDVMPANIVTSFNNFQNFVINSSDDEFKTGLSTYADVNSLIDYYIFQYVICGLDSMGKNQLFFTYDGIKWIASSYDMDSTFGMYWNGQRFVSTTYRMQEDYESMASGRPGNLLYIRMEQLFCDEIKARYAELRVGVLSYANIVNEFERFMDVIGKDLYAEDLTIYTGIPSGNTNNIQQIRNYTRDRLTYVDTQIEALTPPVEPVPCTGIVLSADTLSFTTTDTQTLSVVVSPDNCTDTVTWSVSPSGVATVVDGVVTPVSNGECTITATCGSYSDTCNVTVALPSVECTGITLNKNILTLGGNSETENENLLENVNASAQGRNLQFDSIALEPGLYRITNINNKGFSWLGYNINNTEKKEPNKGSNSDTIFILDEASDVVLTAFPATNDKNNLALYRYDNNLTSLYKLPLSGKGYYNSACNLINSDTDDYSENIALDNKKIYLIKNTSAHNTKESKCITIEDGVYHGQTLESGGYICVANTSLLSVSVNTTTGVSVTDLELYELKATSNKERLTATVTPSNCTQPVVWSVSPQGIVTVDNGLVTAVANGEATVTATCGSQSATCNVTVSGMSESGGDSGENANLVFQVNSASMHTAENTLTDNIAGISATLTGNPTVSGNQIAFTANDTFSFDISSLNLTNSNRTFRIKFTPTTLDANIRNAIGIGSGNDWISLTTSYVNSTKLILQFGKGGFANITAGSARGNYGENRLSVAPVTGQEYELVISENINGNVRWYIDGVLVQSGTTALCEPLYIHNTEGNSRFVGSYSLIEIYNGYCNDYTEFTNMVNSRNN